MNKSPIVIILERKNITSFGRYTKHCIAVRIPGPNLYKQKPVLYVLLDKSEERIERTILPSYHLEMVFRGLDPAHAAQMGLDFECDGRTRESST